MDSHLEEKVAIWISGNDRTNKLMFLQSHICNAVNTTGRQHHPVCLLWEIGLIRRWIKILVYAVIFTKKIGPTPCHIWIVTIIFKYQNHLTLIGNPTDYPFAAYPPDYKHGLWSSPLDVSKHTERMVTKAHLLYCTHIRTWGHHIFMSIQQRKRMY